MVFDLVVFNNLTGVNSFVAEKIKKEEFKTIGHVLVAQTANVVISPSLSCGRIQYILNWVPQVKAITENEKLSNLKLKIFSRKLRICIASLVIIGLKMSSHIGVQ